MTAVNQNSRPFFERHAWKILLGISMIIGLFGIGDMLGGASDLQEGEAVLMQSITGTTWNALKASSPKVANLIDMKWRMDGAALFTVAVLSGAICLRGFRRGERWAWIALWTLPLWAALIAFFIGSVDRDPSIGVPVPVISGSILTVVAVVTLGLLAGAFFRERVE